MAWPESWVHTSCAQQLRFGAGAVRDLGEVVRAAGLRRVLLVTTPGRQASDEGAAVVRALGRSLAATFAGVEPMVPASSVQGAMAEARAASVDGVVSFGGGSAVDVAKAVAFFTEHEAGTPGASHLDRPALPHVAVPTTYAGAAESATFAMTDARARSSTDAGGPTVMPVAVVYDPQLTLDLPASASASTACTALAAAVTAATSPARSPEAEAVALRALPALAEALPAVVDEPGELAPRARLQAAAGLAGRALAGAATGAQHGLAQLLAGRTGLPHGLAHAALLVPVLRYDAEFGGEELAAVGTALGDPDDPAGVLERLLEQVGLPVRLSSRGIGPDDLDAVARLAGGHPAVARNPRPVGELDVRALLEEAW
jgi:maleylacetate reductase